VERADVSSYLQDPLRLTSAEATYAASVGEMVALGYLTMEQGTDLIYLLPGRHGTTLEIDVRYPMRPTYWLKNAAGDKFMHGLHIRLCHAMRDAASAMTREIERQQFEIERQETAGRKVAGPLLAAGGCRDQILEAIRTRCPLLTEEMIKIIADEEGAWWLRWRHDRGYGAPMGICGERNFDGAAQ
jgi:hypothetical protein